MPVSTTIKELCTRLNISIAELARRNSTSPQAFNQKLRREAFTPAELDEIAQSVGCRYDCAFILPDGERVADEYPIKKKGGVATLKPRFLTDADLERRCRYRLSLHGLKMHKVKGNSEPVYYLYEDGEDDSIPEENFRFMNMMKLQEYCEELEQQDAEAREEKRDMGR